MFSNLSISTVIRISLMILFIALVFGAGGIVRDFAVLLPSAVLDRAEVWRLLLYPFVPDPGSLLIAALVFGDTAERVEDLLGTRRFGLLLLLLILIPGALHLLIFGTEEVPLSGSLNLSLSLALASYYVFPDGESRVLFFNLRRIVFTVLVLFAGVLILAISLNEWGEPGLLITNGPAAAFITLFWFHLRYRVSRLFPRLSDRLYWLGGRGGTEEMRGSRFGDMSAHRRTPGEPRLPRERQRPSPAQRADALLEKIAERGVDSLTQDERDFLDDYSKRL